jgi:MFS family permease
MRNRCSTNQCYGVHTKQRNKNRVFQTIHKRFSNTPVEAMMLFLAMGISLLGDSSLYVLLPIHAADIGIPVAFVGVLLSVNRFVRLGTNYYVQRLNDRIGGRNLFLMSIILAAVTTLFYGLPVGAIVFTVSRALWGGCWSAMRLVCLTKVGEYSSDATRGTLTGVFNSTVRIGSLAATLLGGVLAELVGFRNTYSIFAASTLMIGLPLVIFSRKHIRRESQGKEGALESKSMVPEEIKPETNKEIKRRIGLKSAYILAFLNSWIGSGLLATTIGYILNIRFGSSINIFNISIGISVAASFLASLKWFYGISLPVFFGKLSDRYGRFNMAAATCCMLALSLMMIAFAHSFFAISFGIVIAFAGYTALTSILDATAVDHNCMAENKNILGSFMTFNDLGAAIGAITGYSLTVAIGYNSMYLICSLALLITLGIIILTAYLPAGNLK